MTAATTTTGDSSRPVGWLLAAAAEVPAGERWLHPAERQALAQMRFARRRQEWRLGRWAAKQALTAQLDIGTSSSSLSRLEIRPGQNGAPDAFLDGVVVSGAVSLSHSHGLALAAVVTAEGTVGCDLERIEADTPRYVRSYLTAREQGYLDRVPDASRSHLATLLWSAKESALKALRTGMTLDTREVEVEIEVPLGAAPDWRPLRVLAARRQRSFHGWWRDSGTQVLTLLTDSATAVPLRLRT